MLLLFDKKRWKNTEKHKKRKIKICHVGRKIYDISFYFILEKKFLSSTFFLFSDTLCIFYHLNRSVLAVDNAFAELLAHFSIKTCLFLLYPASIRPSLMGFWWAAWTFTSCAVDGSRKKKVFKLPTLQPQAEPSKTTFEAADLVCAFRARWEAEPEELRWFPGGFCVAVRNLLDSSEKKFTHVLRSPPERIFSSIGQP